MFLLKVTPSKNADAVRVWCVPKKQNLTLIMLWL